MVALPVVDPRLLTGRVPSCPGRAGRTAHDQLAREFDVQRIESMAFGKHWTTAVANARGSGQFTTADIHGGPIRYVRITLTVAPPNNWWSVADVRAYGNGE